jgi:hypothetical protein
VLKRGLITQVWGGLIHGQKERGQACPGHQGQEGLHGRLHTQKNAGDEALPARALETGVQRLL